MDLLSKENMDVQPNLTEGSSFMDIVTASQTEPQGTPEADANVSPATEGGTPSDASPEVPGILKDPEPEGDEETPDLSADAELQKHLDAHPIVKARYEAFVAQKERGIQKFIESNKVKTQELETQNTELKNESEAAQPLLQFYERFEDSAESALEAYRFLGEKLAMHWKRPFTESLDGGDDAAQPAEASKYGLTYPSDDKIVDHLLDQMEARFKKFEEKLTPLQNERAAMEQARAQDAKAAEALPALKAEFETTDKPWVTKEMTLEAMKAFPGLLPVDAFAARYRREIAKYMAENSQGKPVRPLPGAGAGVTDRPNLKPGATFAEIVASHSVLS